MSKHERLSDLLLLAVTVVWGTSYGIVKNALAFYPVLGLLALRFGLTFVLLSPMLRALGRAQSRPIVGALGAGLLLFAIFLCETFGVLRTSASNAAFLISLSVVLTPLVEWAMLRRRPMRVEWLAVMLSLLGAWLLSGAAFAPGPGDALILLAALLRALNVCVTKRVLRDPALEPLAMTAIQAGVVTSGSVVVAILVAPTHLPALPVLTNHVPFWISIVYLVLVCTLFAFFVQTYAVRHRSPTRVALQMGSEPAFGAVFAFVWLGERLPISAWIGGGLIVIAS